VLTQHDSEHDASNGAHESQKAVRANKGEDHASEHRHGEDQYDKPEHAQPDVVAKTGSYSMSEYVVPDPRPVRDDQEHGNTQDCHRYECVDDC
jgi:hypothetical protein